MATPQNFRTALNGFNREDVVRYLEYLNTQHKNQLNQLTAEKDALQTQLDQMLLVPRFDPQLKEDLDAMTQERDALRAQLEEAAAQQEALLAQVAQLQTAQQAQAAPEEPAGLTGIAAEELEAYRRAERIECTAREKAELVYHQVSGILSQATGKMDGITDDLTVKADEVMEQLTQLQITISSSKQALQDAVSLMNTIRPNL